MEYYQLCPVLLATTEISAEESCSMAASSVRKDILEIPQICNLRIVQRLVHQVHILTEEVGKASMTAFLVLRGPMVKKRVSRKIRAQEDATD